MTVIYTLHIPRWHPAKINDLYAVHWAARHRMKKADKQMILAYALQAKIPRATRKRRVTLRILLKPRQRGGDPDSMWKSTLDSCVYAGLLIDDNRQHVEVAPVQYERATNDTWGTHIYLEDI